ncbi:MAG: hypothetical protein Q9213_006823 [Squamulea squamosa]
MVTVYAQFAPLTETTTTFKMQFSTLFIAAAAPFLVSASPTSRRSTSSDGLSKKGLFDGGIPLGCSFAGRNGNAYIEHPVGDDNSKSCFGWDNGGAINCGKKRYSVEEYNNIKAAVREQVTKDGQWDSSTAGAWTATFNLGTTAFDDRDTKAFDDTLDSISVDGSSGVAELTYYWQRNVFSVLSRFNKIFAQSDVFLSRGGDPQT